MKNVITTFSAAMVLLASCSTSTEKKQNNEDSTVVKTETSSTPVLKKNKISDDVIPADFSELVPIDVLDTKSKNVYEKYGVEFSGNCYSCDLANLSVTNKRIIWANVCDEKDTFEINDFSFINEGNKTILKTAERTYILTQTDKAPVYELIVEGKKLELKNKRLSRFFTTKKALPLFKEHDCGDFEG
ncbi:hypothetical protein EGY07_09760 [Chryseobacterium indologenes]|uniref:hypothetical protein n=2 Tax=Chryseobacterium indologenes TaxID=253 RepID=UPI000F4E8A8E|nr:hypothetical protein [Chryseobacterium indologenes]AYZ35837.1 hypothetical protein EGY07_09760 [Chryseobacterium indologenes]MBF6644614.1 hypothetical protein [Chryseobacterium indologenes]QQQ71690.1 hypothetical protein JHW31_02880 [Chryseobacterium indologenes]